METVNEAIAERRPICGFVDKKMEAENVKPYSIVRIGYPAEDVDWEAGEQFDARRVHYNKYR